jgi:hypothetical protein
MVFRVSAVALLVGVICIAGSTLLAKPGTGGGWTPCPWPPCMAPCVLGAEPDVLCKIDGGKVVKTSWTCCCCGGGGNSYKPLD